MLFRAIRIKFHSEMAKLHSASPREITSPFTREIYPYYTQKHVITYTYSTQVIPDTRNVKYQPIFRYSMA